jgi:lysyl-tRNA synthetase class 2
MDLTEELFALLATKVSGTTVVKYGERELDFARWQRLTMREAICRYWPAAAGAAPSVDELGRPGGPRAAAERYNAMAQAAAATGPEPPPEQANAPLLGWQAMSDGELTGLLFETVAEPNLIQPAIIYDFPTDISPLAKCRPDDPSLVERFEVFIAGMELGNAFSELNDPDEQERRLLRQVSQGGEEVPREVDFDYVRALAHGLPPTAGMGVGIDRLTMLLTDSRSIREVILFPLLRPESASRSAGQIDSRAAAQGGDSGSNSGTSA